MTERQIVIHRQSGSVSFTQCHCCKETRWRARGMCHSAVACCCGVITRSINYIYLSRFKRLWHIFLSVFGIDQFVTACLFPVFFLALPCLCTMDRSTYVSSTMRWPTPTNASATLWQCTMAAGDSDFLKSFPLCYSISKMLEVSCAFSAKRSCKRRLSRVGVFR